MTAGMNQKTNVAHQPSNLGVLGGLMGLLLLTSASAYAKNTCSVSQIVDNGVLSAYQIQIKSGAKVLASVDVRPNETDKNHALEDCQELANSQDTCSVVYYEATPSSVENDGFGRLYVPARAAHTVIQGLEKSRSYSSLEECRADQARYLLASAYGKKSWLESVVERAGVAHTRTGAPRFGGLD